MMVSPRDSGLDRHDQYFCQLTDTTRTQGRFTVSSRESNEMTGGYIFSHAGKHTSRWMRIDISSTGSCLDSGLSAVPIFGCCSAYISSALLLQGKSVNMLTLTGFYSTNVELVFHLNRRIKKDEIKNLSLRQHECSLKSVILVAVVEHIHPRVVHPCCHQERW